MAFSVNRVILNWLIENKAEGLKSGQIAEKLLKPGDEKLIPSSLRDELRELKQKKEETIELQDATTEFRNVLKTNVQGRLRSLRDRGEVRREENEGTFKYFFNDQNEQEDSQEIESSISKETEKGKEDLLYGELANYLKNIPIGSKRINESKSSNKLGKGANKWLHPDLVGIEHLSEKWKSDVIACMGEQLDKKIKLWSFEVKTELKKGDVREAFFQAVSNSSWANFGYLVAKKIGDVDDELKMLSNHFGIGVIMLAPETEQGGYIKFPAKEKSSVDWGVINRLAAENTDFKECIEKILVFHQSKISDQSKTIDRTFWNLEKG